MSIEVTEISTETTTQLEISDLGSGRIEVVDPGTNSFEISLSGSAVTSDLDVIAKTETIVVNSVNENTVISIDEQPVVVQVTQETTQVDVNESILLSGTFDLSFNNLIDNPFSFNRGDTKVGKGVLNPDFELHVSGNLFSDIVSSSTLSSKQLKLDSDGTTNIILVSSQSRTPVLINPKGVVVLDNYQYTPSAVQGGLLYSGSEFYLGLE
jgi:hypothetical protein